jgi:hypothetical protein
MDKKIIVQILFISIEYSVYIWSLSLIAWIANRKLDKDAFHLVFSNVIGFLLIFLFTVKYELDWMFLFYIIPIITFTLDELIIEVLLPRENIFKKNEINSTSFLNLIIIATFSLIFYDWVTAHIPINFFLPNLYGETLLFISALLALLIFKYYSRRKYGKILKLGHENKWAIEYWMKPTIKTPPLYYLGKLLLWFPILYIPTSTTGILSFTILKNTTLAIIIARIVGTRGIFFMFSICLTLGLLRTTLSFLFLNPLNQAIVEGSIFVCLIIWMQHKGKRSKWKNNDL